MQHHLITSEDRMSHETAAVSRQKLMKCCPPCQIFVCYWRHHCHFSSWVISAVKFKLSKRGPHVNWASQLFFTLWTLLLLIFLAKKSAFHPVLYPGGQDRASVTTCQCAAWWCPATLLPAWCKLVQTGSVQQAMEKKTCQSAPAVIILLLSVHFPCLLSEWLSDDVADIIVPECGCRAAASAWPHNVSLFNDLLPQQLIERCSL